MQNMSLQSAIDSMSSAITGFQSPNWYKIEAKTLLVNRESGVISDEEFINMAWDKYLEYRDHLEHCRG